MKILALTASSQVSGNSETLLDAYLSAYSSDDYKKIHIYDMDIAPWSYTCKVPDIKKEPKLSALMQDFQEANMIVIATPVYNFGEPGPLKNFIDRIGYCSLDYTQTKFGQPIWLLGDKRIIVINTGWAPKLFQMLLFPFFPAMRLRVIFGYYGVRKYKAYYEGNLDYSKPASKRPKLLEKYLQLWKKHAKKYRKV